MYASEALPLGFGVQNYKKICNIFVINIEKVLFFSNFFLEEYLFEYGNSLVNGGDLPCFTDKKTSKV